MRTIHKAMPFICMSDCYAPSLRRGFALQCLLVDEVSMVGSNMLLEIHKRLQEIKGASADKTFGGVSILAVGDLFQLPPVCQPHLFGLVSDAYARLHKTGSLER